MELCRRRIEDLNPEWLSDGHGRERMGLAFTCPVHGAPCRLDAWFEHPNDGGLHVTQTDGRMLHQHEGDLWDELGLYPPISHGEWLVFLWGGNVVAG